jgi:DNA-binding CsgD family transcriptional regulator
VERVADVNSYRTLARQRPSVGLLSAATGSQLSRSVRHREVHAPVGIGDELRVVLQDGRGCWGFLNLYRETGDRSFDPEAGRLLAGLVPALATALRRSLHRGAPGADAGAAPPGVLILDDELRLRSQTSAAREWLAALTPPGLAGAGPPMPTPVSAVAARLLGQEAGVDPGRAPRARVRLAGRQWAVLHAARLEGAEGGIAVTIEQARPAEVLDLLSQAWNLTPRERQLLELVQAGLDTGQIADRLCISPHTVQDHLKAIFEKAGVHSRRELVGGLVGPGRM